MICNLFPRLVCAVFLVISIVGIHAAEWYQFEPKNDNTSPSALGLEAWSSSPAGAQGLITAQENKLMLAGKEIKLWGLNNSFANCAPEKELADKRAAFYRKFGINAVRFHKYADGPDWAGIQSKKSFVAFDPEGFERMDYYISVLKKNGIYTKLSPTFGVKFGEDDFERVPFHEEIGSLNKGRISSGHGWVFLSKEIQDLQIEQTTSVLKHKNPHTGLRYADDPAIFCVEMFNEDCVLFYTTNGCLARSPTIRTRTAKAFSEWLKQKYSTTEAWIAAWGEKTLLGDGKDNIPAPIASLFNKDKVNGSLAAENIEEGTVVPWGNPWYYDESLKGSSGLAPFRTRFLDTQEFLISLQNDFYSRFSAAIRATGFKGLILTSNWHCGEAVAHFLNLESDAQYDIIDRHNYSGGRRRNSTGGNRGSFSTVSMLAAPGSNLLSSAYHQVKNKPFMLSEYALCFPTEWQAEVPVVLGAYGWGLQGWDVSFMFQNGDEGTFLPAIGRRTWEATNPATLGVYPVVSRMVRRLDVSEATETATLNVSHEDLLKGKIDFSAQGVHNADEKSFSTDKIPNAVLAITRVAVAFSDKGEPTKEFDLAPYLEGETVVSATKQLRWTPAPKGCKNGAGGYITISTAATKGFVGFAPGEQTFDLGDGWSITPAKGFATILFSAKGEKETLANATEIIVTAMARARNMGASYSADEDELSERGEAPVMLEAVQTKLTLPLEGSLELLDHDGIAPTVSRKFQKTLELDGSMDKTPFYIIRKN